MEITGDINFISEQEKIIKKTSLIILIILEETFMSSHWRQTLQLHSLLNVI
jgi:hypothetical protein